MTELLNGSDNAPCENDTALQLVVFSDDWGRHPSSCQHLTRQMLPTSRVLWVNTIGTRAPRLCREDLHKAMVKISQWIRRSPDPDANDDRSHANLRVSNPRMYPGFRRIWQRKINSHLISRSVNHALGPRRAGERRVAISTIPITADLIGRIDVDRWVYYCVDDFSVWPGLDGPVIDRMERAFARKVDAVVAVSQTLVGRLSTMGCDAHLLTHGISVSHWSTVQQTKLPDWWSTLEEPIYLFWGVVDQRLDLHWCRALAEQCGTLLMVGPQQSPDARLRQLKRAHLPGAVPFDDLPSLARAANVLVMPYADIPVTRAIQPLKFKEYLATGRPVVVRKLPATVPWSDAADVLENVDELVKIARQRALEDTPLEQQQARKRLANEEWETKAQQFRAIALAA